MVKADPIFSAQCSEQMATALELLQSGGVIVLPTDTLYGLAADVFNEAALERVFTIKGRPSDLALPVLVSDWKMMNEVATYSPPLAKTLAQKYWPGPLTLVLPKSASLSNIVTGGRDTVAVRSPNHHAPLGVIARLGHPITGTSANRSGAADLTSIAEVRLELGAMVDYIMDCGPAPAGIPSTVVDLTGNEPKLLREGVIPFSEIVQAMK